MSDSGKRYKTLFGSETSSDKIVGFCRLHRVHLTARQVETKQCAGKCCRWLKKWECEYWAEKEQRKALRQMKKEAGIPPWQKVKIKNPEEIEILKNREEILDGKLDSQ